MSLHGCGAVSCEGLGSLRTQEQIAYGGLKFLGSGYLDDSFSIYEVGYDVGEVLHVRADNRRFARHDWLHRILTTFAAEALSYYDDVGKVIPGTKLPSCVGYPGLGSVT